MEAYDSLSLFVLLEIKVRGSPMPGKHSTSELLAQSQSKVFLHEVMCNILEGKL